MSGSTHPEARMHPLVRAFTTVGEAALNLPRHLADAFGYLGGLGYLLGDSLRSMVRTLLLRRSRFGAAALVAQMVRVGVNSIPIIVLVQTFIGIILALQLAPTLRDYGSLDKIANIIGLAMFREMGPLLSAVVLSGYAGAAIAAELGAMVEAEEIKALRAHALDPVRFLVVPRLLATTLMMLALTVVADVVGVMGGLMTSWLVLDIHPRAYLANTQAALLYRDFFTGLFKGGVFGLLIALIACYQGLTVSGGAEGVGRGTTLTVVRSIVALIATDCVITVIFYRFGL